jgi:hypothetical protein
MKRVLKHGMFSFFKCLPSNLLQRLLLLWIEAIADREPRSAMGILLV